jgi:hypothetical protein
MADPTPETPTLEQFLIEYPLYKKFTFFSKKEFVEVEEVKRFFQGVIDAYCPDCKKHSIFQIPESLKISLNTTSSGRKILSPSWDSNGMFTIYLVCSRRKNHRLRFDIQLDHQKMQKIGQFPSFNDLHSFDAKKYISVLGKKAAYPEFIRAIGLASHGIGIGSFVYLRRIFEGLVGEAHQIARIEPGWDEELYLKGRMPEKVQILADHLPDFLVENRTLYAILSKGIHELSEDECLDAFPVVKLGIERILDAKIREIEEQKKSDEARKAIQGLTKSI